MYSKFRRKIPLSHPPNYALFYLIGVLHRDLFDSELIARQKGERLLCSSYIKELPWNGNCGESEEKWIEQIFQIRSSYQNKHQRDILAEPANRFYQGKTFPWLHFWKFRGIKSFIKKFRQQIFQFPKRFSKNIFNFWMLRKCNFSNFNWK